MTILKTVLYEANPLNDFKDIRFYNHFTPNSLEEKLRAQAKNIANLVTISKLLARGAIIGGTVGTLASLVRGDSLADGFKFGAWIGAYLDFNQYMIRGLYHYTVEQISSVNK